MVAIKNLIFIASGVAALVIPRDATSTELSDLETINSDTQALTSAVNAYTSGLIQALPIASADNTLDSAIKTATSDANSSPVVDAADAEEIINYINNTLYASVVAAVDAIISKKSALESAGAGGLVSSDLSTLVSDTQALGNALVAKAPESEQSAAQAALAQINAQLSRASAAFPSS